MITDGILEDPWEHLTAVFSLFDDFNETDAEAALRTLGVAVPTQPGSPANPGNPGKLANPANPGRPVPETTWQACGLGSNGVVCLWSPTKMVPSGTLGTCSIGKGLDGIAAPEPALARLLRSMALPVVIFHGPPDVSGIVQPNPQSRLSGRLTDCGTVFDGRRECAH